MFTELEQQEKFSPSVGVLCLNPREAVIIYSYKHWADVAGSMQAGWCGQLPIEALGQV